MFDSKEVAQKALLRIEQLNRVKQRKRLAIAIIGWTMCITAVLVPILTNYSDSDIMIAEAENQHIYIEEPSVPLARPPTEPLPNELPTICPDCGKEIVQELEDEEEHCCYCEVDEECRHSRRE